MQACEAFSLLSHSRLAGMHFDIVHLSEKPDDAFKRSAQSISGAIYSSVDLSKLTLTAHEIFTDARKALTIRSRPGVNWVVA